MKRILIAATLSLLPLAAIAQEPERKVVRADPQNGAVLAQRWCGTCHIVAKDQTRAIDGVPSFAAIAQRGDLSGEQLAFMLLNPHPAPRVRPAAATPAPRSRARRTHRT